MDIYYNNIKELLINNEVTKKVKEYSINKSNLETKYEVGKLLSEAGKHYGEGIIKKYSIKLTKELGKGYSKRNLWLMLKFYELGQKMQTLSAQLTWSHYIELLSMGEEKKKYYIMLCNKMNLSVRELRSKIKSKEYERLSIETKNKLINKDDLDIKETIPEPIVIKVNSNIDKEKITEKALHKIIVENIKNFMSELGEGYTFVSDEYRIKIDNVYNYIDILLFNYIHNCFVVIELKVTEVKKEHIGQIMTYVNYIDKNIKTIYQNKTIGIILVKRNNKLVLEYSTDKSIICREYEFL